MCSRIFSWDVEMCHLQNQCFQKAGSDGLFPADQTSNAFLVSGCLLAAPGVKKLCRKFDHNQTIHPEHKWGCSHNIQIEDFLFILRLDLCRYNYESSWRSQSIICKYLKEKKTNILKFTTKYVRKRFAFGGKDLWVFEQCSLNMNYL